MINPKTVLARAGRNRTFMRRFPGHLGGASFYASTEGGLKYLRRDVARIDPQLTSLAAKHVRPGNCVWDIGANVGLFTFAAAGLATRAGRVLAVEPDLWLAGLLRKSASKNAGAIARVDVLAVAVSDRGGVASFLIANQSRACNSLEGHGNATTGGVRERQYVPTTALDALLPSFDAPDVVKVDVESAEVDLLKGARTVLEEVRPVLLLEVSPENQAAVTEILRDHAYRLYDPGTDEAVEMATWSTVAVPN